MAQEKGKPHLLILFFIFLTDVFLPTGKILLEESLNFLGSNRNLKIWLWNAFETIFFFCQIYQLSRLNLLSSSVVGSMVWAAVCTTTLTFCAIGLLDQPVSCPQPLWSWQRMLCLYWQLSVSVVSGSMSPPFHLSLWNTAVICYFHGNFPPKSSIKPSVNLLPVVVLFINRFYF